MGLFPGRAPFDFETELVFVARNGEEHVIIHRDGAGKQR
jgi:hypothetical protein